MSTPDNHDQGAGLVDAIADLAPDPQILVVEPDKQAYLITPKDAQATPIDLEALQPHPARPRNTVHPSTVGDLIKYTTRHVDGCTTIWVDADSRTVTAILNDHDPSARPGWGDHRAVLKLTTTPEWDHWAGSDQCSLTQLEFAEHIEDGYNELVDPDAATMLELAQDLEGSAGGSFKSRQRLSDGSIGVQFDHDVTITGGGSDQVAFPDRLELRLCPLIGEDPVAMTARLRVRVNAGKLTITYKLDRPQQVIRTACDLIVEQLREEFAHVYLGRP